MLPVRISAWCLSIAAWCAPAKADVTPMRPAPVGERGGAVMPFAMNVSRRDDV